MRGLSVTMGLCRDVTPTIRSMYGITAKIMEAAIGIISGYIRIYFWDNGKEMKIILSLL